MTDTKDVFTGTVEKEVEVVDNDSLLQALLNTEITPKAQVKMTRFNAVFEIKALKESEIQACRERATYGKKLDEDKFAALLIESACISPNWSDERLKQFGARPTDVIQARLLGGEIMQLTERILDLSGYGDGLVETIKN